MLEHRKTPRYASIAHAKVFGLTVGDAVLRDLSITGCRLEFSAAVALTEGSRYKLVIQPEDVAEVEDFELEVEARWSRADYDSFEVGFSILASPKGKAFLRYVDYLAWLSKSAAEV